MGWVDSELAYVAGAIDFDGSISIVKAKDVSHKNGYSFNLYVRVKNTNLAIMEWLVEHFGGSYCESTKATKVWRTAYAWSIASQQALLLLKAIFPYMVIKKDRAEIAIEFQSNKHNERDWYTHPKTEMELAQDEAYYQMMKKLNRRGN